ncbi:MAG: choice-of-anchor D domain-containing protein [Acidobacteria bacterium]|nr:choice-of-anchor D domain-containing protein [Acidobacteriota bacterium]
MKPLLFCLSVLPLAAQLQVGIVRESGVELIGATLNLGTVASGEVFEARLRAANLGASPIAINDLSIGGAGFSLAAPFVPFALQSGATHDFAIRFLPTAPGSYSASLVAGSFTSIVRATAAVAAEVVLIRGVLIVPIPPSGLAFDAFVGETLSYVLNLRNPLPAAMPLDSLRVTGAGFRYEGPPSASLAPGASIQVRIIYTATAEGSFRGTLEAGVRRLPLMAIVAQPRIGPPRIQRSLATPKHAEQLPIRVNLERPLPMDATGTLSVTFSGGSTDPAIQFHNGAREIPFLVPAGTIQAEFDGKPEAILQTGTTAGRLTLTATTEGGASVDTINFPRTIIAVDQVTASREGSSIAIVITGYDNTRTAGSANFRFADRAGNPIGGVITARFEEEFRAYYAGDPAGGAFRLRAVFPVTGDATMVGSVLIELANNIGRTELQRINIP